MRDEPELARGTVGAVEDDVLLGVGLRVLVQDRHRPIDRAGTSDYAALLAAPQRLLGASFLSPIFGLSRTRTILLPQPHYNKPSASLVRGLGSGGPAWVRAAAAPTQTLIRKRCRPGRSGRWRKK